MAGSGAFSASLEMLMKLIQGLKRIKEGRGNNLVLAIGVFDGVHLGHQKIIKMVVERARQVDGTSMILTFDPHPRSLINPQNSPRPITLMDEKISIFSSLGIEKCMVINFNRRFASLSPADFVSRILSRGLGVSEIFVASNYLFGKEKKGNVAILRQMGKKLGFKVNSIRPLHQGGEIVSSSRIRLLIENGKVKEAGKLLGRPYSISGNVTRGKKLAVTTGYPTANVKVRGKILPAKGAYIARVEIKRKLHPAILGMANGLMEVHALDFKDNIYNNKVRIFFLHKIREWKQFGSHYDRKKQLIEDERVARKFFGRGN
jgi:riboflavin kinase/FMN adenylyltransferase